MAPRKDTYKNDLPEKLVWNEALVDAFVDGQLEPDVEEQVLAVVEKRPELLQSAVVLSSIGFLQKLRAVHQRSDSKKTPARQLAGDSAGSPDAVDQSAKTSEKPHVAARPGANTVVPTELANYAGYRVLKELGRGGMGVVYLAQNVGLDRLEVLKVLSERLLDHAGAKERFMREIRAVSKLNHANIVTSHSILPLAGQMVFAMEYVHGMDLHNFIHKHTPLPITLACSFARQIAAGLQHAHEKGLVHRDIKPSNVIVHKSDGLLQVKILDFGLAKATSEKSHSGLTQDGSLLGTPEFMSPEQILNAAKADIRADIYGLGCTLYCMLVGQPPFGGTHGEVLMAHSQQEARPVNLVRPEVPSDLSAVVAKMMAKDPSRRYQTPNEVYAALKPFLNRQHLQRSMSKVAEIDTVNDLASPSCDTSVEAPLIELSLTPEYLPSPDLSVQQQISTFMAGHRQRRASQNRRSQRRPNWFRRNITIAITIIGTLMAGLLWPVTLTFRTSEGTLIVDNLPPAAEVLIDGQRLEIKWNSGKSSAEMRVVPGKRQVEVRSKGVKVAGELVKIAANQRVTMTVRVHTPTPTPTPDARLSEADEKEKLTGNETAPASTHDATVPDGPPSIVKDGELPLSGSDAGTFAVGHWRALFNGRDLTGWRTDNDPTRTFTVQNQTLVGAGNEASLVSANEFREFELEAEVAISGTNSGIFFGGASGYECELCIPSSDRFHALGSVLLVRPASGRKKPAVLNRVHPASGQWFRLTLVNTKVSLQVRIDEELIVDETGPLVVDPGPIEIQQWTSSGQIAFRKLRIRAIDSSPLPSMELLRNPSCEERLGIDGTIPGWTVAQGAWQTRHSDPPPKDGYAYFFAKPGAISELVQEVDVSTYFTDGRTDETAVRYECYLRSWRNPYDTAETRLEILDASGQMIDSFTSGEKHSTTNWEQYSVTTKLPREACTLRVRLISRRNEGTNNDGYFDHLSLKFLEEAQP